MANGRPALLGLSSRAAANRGGSVGEGQWRSLMPRRPRAERRGRGAVGCVGERGREAAAAEEAADGVERKKGSKRAESSPRRRGPFRSSSPPAAAAAAGAGACAFAPARGLLSARPPTCWLRALRYLRRQRRPGGGHRYGVPATPRPGRARRRLRGREERLRAGAPAGGPRGARWGRAARAGGAPWGSRGPPVARAARPARGEPTRAAASVAAA